MLSLRAVNVVVRKELRSEIRTRYALNALLMFVVTTLSIVLFSIGSENVSPDVLCGILWIIIFFSSMSGLSRTFVSEEERGTTLTLRLLAPPLVVFFGKFIFNVILLFMLNAVAIGLYMLLISGFVVQSYVIFFWTMFLGTIGLAAASTIIAAIISKANTKGTLYPVLSFPIMLPLLLTVITATRRSVEGAVFSEAIGEFQVLISYVVVILAVSYIVFDYIWTD